MSAARTTKATPALTLVAGEDAPAAPLTGAARVKSLIAEANAASDEMVAEYATALRVLAVKAREVAALDKHAPVGIVSAAASLADKLDLEAAGIDAIRNRKN